MVDEASGYSIELVGRVVDDRRIAARALDIPKQNVRVIKPRIGGGFGAKQTLVSELFPAIVTLKTGKPIAVVLVKTGNPAEVPLIDQIIGKRFHLLIITGSDVDNVFSKGFPEEFRTSEWSKEWYFMFFNNWNDRF